MIPIAFLLEQVGQTFRREGVVFNAWLQVLTIEESVARRVRGAFLVSWFGPQLPLLGTGVGVIIANLSALRDRFVQLRRSDEDKAIPFLGTLSVWAGVAIGGSLGMLANPFVAFRGAIALWRRGWHGLALAMPFLGILGLGLLGVVGAVGLTAAPALALALSDAAFVGTLAKAARRVSDLMDVTTVLIRQILGPREEIKNPLLRKIFVVLDSLSGLSVQMLGFLEIFSERIAPKVLPFLTWSRVAVAVLGDSWGLLSDVVRTTLAEAQQTGADLQSRLDGIGSTLKKLVTVLGGLTGPIKRGFSQVTQSLQEVAAKSYDRHVRDVIAGWLGEGDRQRPKSFAILNTITSRLQNKFITKAFDVLSGGSKSDNPSDSLEKGLDDLRLLGSQLDQSLGVKGLGAWTNKIDQSLAGFRGIKVQKYVLPPLPAFVLPVHPPASAQAEQALRTALQPPRLLPSLAESPLEEVASSAARLKRAYPEIEQALPRYLKLLLQRLMPPELGPMADTLDSLMGIPKTKLRAEPPEQTGSPPFPVRHVKENDELFPSVRRLLVRAPGFPQQQVDSFTALIVDALKRQAYVVGAAEPG